MLIRLDDLESTKSTRLRKSGGWVVRDNPSNGIRVGLITATVQATVGSSMSFVPGMIREKN
jgi:hypothetical protein